MTVWRLISKEIIHRKLNFALGAISVVVAVAVLAGAFSLLRAHDLCTEQLLGSKQEAADRRLAKLEDDYRKYMKELGFNLLILPKDQDLAEFWEKGYATHTMPEEYVTLLANSGTQTMRHLLPIVQQNVFWPEQKRRVILIGTRGEVPLKHRRPKEPMLLAVREGEAVIGHTLARDLDLKPGGTLRLLGRDFVIDKCRPERGSAEDATIWVDLAAGQQLLKMEGRINAIEALKCHCAGVTVDDLRREVAAVFNDPATKQSNVKVVVRENKVTLRAKARARVRGEHEKAMAEERAGRDRLRRTRQAFASVLVPLVLVGAAVWIGFLALMNVRQRSAEIGILRAIGVRSMDIFSVFLVKALAIGLVGALAGYVLGLAASVVTVRFAESLNVQHPLSLVSPGLLVAVVVAAPMLSALASLAPATLAARQDPAIILSRE